MATAHDANSPMASFIEALNRLNLNSALPRISYPPLQSISSSTPSSASSTSGNSYTGPGGQPTVPTQISTYHSIQELMKAYRSTYEYVVGLYMREVLNAWTPRPLSPEETREFLAATHRRLDRIRELEDAKNVFAPLLDPATEDALFVARIDHTIHFAQIFRINDLPPEILGNIFRYVVWSSNSVQKGVQWRLRLTWTCRNWRRVALADSTIWTAIWFHPPHLDRAFTWLERAGTAPVDVRFGDTAENTLTLEVAAELIERVFVKLSTIRMIIATFVNWEPLMYLVHALGRASQIPMVLERLELHRTGAVHVQLSHNHPFPPFRRPMALFGGTIVPSFRHFTVNGVHLDWERSPLVNLAMLDLRRIPLQRVPSFTTFRSMLVNNSTLKKLILHGAGPNWPDGPITSMEPILLPNLKGLIMGDFSLAYATYVVTQFHAPNIVELTLMNVITSEDYSAFFKCITSKMPALKVFTIYNAEIGEPSGEATESFVGWLKSVPDLRYLRVSQVSAAFLRFFLFDTETLELGTFLDNDTLQQKAANIVCPKLAYLEYHEVKTDIISAWVLKRRLLGAPLEKVYVGMATASKVSPQHQRSLFEAFGRVKKLFVLSAGVRSPEEILLLQGS
ncbi:hypothetical protein M413DRAFT_447849, partial [Hebeloma cylindrosporum]